MIQQAIAQWIVTYDIREPRRLRRIHRYLKSTGIPIQYSVFWVLANDMEMSSIVGNLKQLMDEDCDDIRAYKLPDREDHVMIGCPLFPEGIFLPDRAKTLFSPKI
jgi:CRISPR-associated protein Cas2